MDANELLLLLVGILLAGVVNKAARLKQEGKKALGAGRKSLAQGHEQVKKGRKALALSLPWTAAALALGFVLIKLLLAVLSSR